MAKPKLHGPPWEKAEPKTLDATLVQSFAQDLEGIFSVTK